MRTQLIERYGTASLQAELPPAPHGEIANLARRACSILHLRDRWKYVGWAMLLALVAFALLFAGVVAHNDLLVLCAFAGFICAFAMAIRLRPTALETQVAQTEGEMDKLTAAFDSECQDAADRFASSALAALKHEAQTLIQEGFSLAELGEWKNDTRNLFQSLEAENANTLTAHQDAVKTRRDDFQRRRKLLNGVGHSLKAKFVAGPARRVARDALNAAAEMAEARIEEIVAKAQLRASHLIAEALARNDATEVSVPTPPAPPQTPVWLGTPLPPPEVMESEAEKLVESNLNVLRSRVIEGEDDEALTTEITKLFNGTLSRPNSVEDYVASLNGEGGEWAERILREATPFSPVSTIAGKPRFRKLLVMTRGAANSDVFRSLREALSDQALQIVAREHPETDLLCMEDEWCLCASEFPEVAELIKEFRALPQEEQALLCTACDAADLRNFFPELPADHARPTRLLPVARVFDVIQRSGSEDYIFDEVIFAKGYRAALEALTLDHALAARVAAKVEAVVSAEGVSAALARLTAARNNASSLVPKEFAKTFKAGIDEAVSELNRRSTVLA